MLGMHAEDVDIEVKKHSMPGAYGVTNNTGLLATAGTCEYHGSIPEMTSTCLVMHDGDSKVIWSQKLSLTTMRLMSD
jgi:hypothetical protein